MIAQSEAGAPSRSTGWPVIHPAMRYVVLLGIPAALIVVLYGATLVGLASEWFTNADYSHGPLIPIAVAYFLWEKREKLRSLPAQPSWFGLAIILASQLVNLVGFLGAEFFLQRISFLMLLAGLVVFLHGWLLLSNLASSFTLLLLAIPLPAIIFNQLTLPLQLQASSWAESLLNVCGIAVLRDGNVLQLSHNLLNVAEACSGMRSLISLLALALMIGEMLRCGLWTKLILIASVVPVGLTTNAMRIAGTGVLAQTAGQAWAEGFFHLFSGWCIFLLACALLLGEALLLQRIARRLSAPNK